MVEQRDGAPAPPQLHHRQQGGAREQAGCRAGENTLPGAPQINYNVLFMFYMQVVYLKCHFRRLGLQKVRTTEG